MRVLRDDRNTEDRWFSRSVSFLSRIHPRYPEIHVRICYAVLVVKHVLLQEANQHLSIVIDINNTRNILSWLPNISLEKRAHYTSTSVYPITRFDQMKSRAAHTRIGRLVFLLHLFRPVFCRSSVWKNSFAVAVVWILTGASRILQMQTRRYWPFNEVDFR